jgi:hypothetical protein
MCVRVIERECVCVRERERERKKEGVGEIGRGGGRDKKINPAVVRGVMRACVCVCVCVRERERDRENRPVPIMHLQSTRMAKWSKCSIDDTRREGQLMYKLVHLVTSRFGNGPRFDS